MEQASRVAQEIVRPLLAFVLCELAYMGGAAVLQVPGSSNPGEVYQLIGLVAVLDVSRIFLVCWIAVRLALMLPRVSVQLRDRVTNPLIFGLTLGLGLAIVDSFSRLL